MRALPTLATVESLPGFTYTDWTADPRAVALFAAARRNPPKLGYRRDRFGDEVERYEGRVAASLRRIRDSYGDPLLALSDAGNKAPFARWCEDTVEAVLTRELAGEQRRAA